MGTKTVQVVQNVDTSKLSEQEFNTLLRKIKATVRKGQDETSPAIQAAVRQHGVSADRQVMALTSVILFDIVERNMRNS